MAVLNARHFALDTRIATVALALILATVTLPIVTGWVAADSHCAFTTDICHPAQAVDLSHAPLLAPAPYLIEEHLIAPDAILAIRDGYRSMTSRLSEAPASPPPKALA
ncbi:MAG TPA: hypothetical protein VKV03_09295 [Candidatus Binataceae bacterium]|nr:hypothetical protein [Candidatus Binataceae bacterium]